MRLHRTQSRRGFTLIELVMVLLVIAVAVAIIAPTLMGSRRSRELSASGVELMAMTKRARTTAISQGVVCRLQFDQGGCSIWVQQGAEFVQKMDNTDDAFSLPEGYQVQITKTSGGTDAIDFYPSGRCEPAQIKLTSPYDEFIVIASTSMAEQFAFQQ